MRFRLACFSIALLFASAALANSCPTAETAKLGFLLEKQGAQAEIRPAHGHFVHAVNTFSGGKRQDAVYYRGLFLVSRFDDTARTINIPVSDLRSVFPLDKKSRRAVTYAPGGPGKVGALVSLELTVTGEEEIQVGSCPYTVLAVRNRAMSDEGRILWEHTDLYSPELSFVLAKRYDEKSGRPTTVRYRSIRSLARMEPL
jgi:hypothetical protein